MDKKENGMATDVALLRVSFSLFFFSCFFLNQMCSIHQVSCVSQISSCLCQGLDGRLSFLEKTLAELKAEGKPANSTLKKIIALLCTDEVRAILLINIHKIC